MLSDYFIYSALDLIGKLMNWNINLPANIFKELNLLYAN
jgi:hypothetical protein